MDGQSRKKRSILINPQFQWHIVGYAAAMSALILASVYGLLLFAFSEFNHIGIEAGLPPEHAYFEFIRLQEGTFHRVLLAIAIVVAALLVSGGLILSHRIAGPIQRLHRELLRAAEKEPYELDPIQFREKDYFPELAEAYNHFVVMRKKSHEP